MTPCGMMNEPVAGPFEIGFSDAWKSIYQATDEILLPSECKNCKKRFACMMCGALTIAEGADAVIRSRSICAGRQRCS